MPESHPEAMWVCCVDRVMKKAGFTSGNSSPRPTPFTVAELVSFVRKNSGSWHLVFGAILDIYGATGAQTAEVMSDDLGGEVFNRQSEPGTEELDEILNRVPVESRLLDPRAVPGEDDALEHPDVGLDAEEQNEPPLQDDPQAAWAPPQIEVAITMVTQEMQAMVERDATLEERRRYMVEQLEKYHPSNTKTLTTLQVVAKLMEEQESFLKLTRVYHARACVDRHTVAPVTPQEGGPPAPAPPKAHVGGPVGQKGPGSGASSSQAGGSSEERRVHPRDDKGLAYTREEFRNFDPKDPAYGLNMWEQAAPKAARPRATPVPPPKSVPISGPRPPPRPPPRRPDEGVPSAVPNFPKAPQARRPPSAEAASFQQVWGGPPPASWRNDRAKPASQAQGKGARRVTRSSSPSAPQRPPPKVPTGDQLPTTPSRRPALGTIAREQEDAAMRAVSAEMRASEERALSAAPPPPSKALVPQGEGVPAPPPGPVPLCVTRGCDRPTYNGQEGETCCQTCRQGRGKHGRECEKRAARRAHAGAPDGAAGPDPEERPSASKGSARVTGKAPLFSHGRLSRFGPTVPAKAGLIQYGGTNDNEAPSSSSRTGNQNREPISRHLERASKARAD